MDDWNKVVSSALLAHPQFKVENGINYKLDHFDMTETGIEPVYVETEEVSAEQAFSILMGEPI